jgi:type VI secretion system (T6SS) baseplate-like injector VgrG
MTDVSEGRTFWGKYRATVIDNADPLMLGRLLCEVPSLPTTLLNWALPCVPYAGEKARMFALPPIGANVWIEFEGGDPEYPIWSGVFWTEPPPPGGTSGAAGPS